MTKILLACVNSSVSLVGYDLQKRSAFWYCPGNILRVCGVCTEENSLWVASDNTVTRINSDGIFPYNLPGPMDNLAHSVKVLSKETLAVVDTGNSRILLLHTEGGMAITRSPLQEWEFALPHDAIHCNDVIAWRDGFLVSAFSHQPFRNIQKKCPTWKQEGLGVIFYIRSKQGQIISSVVASGLNCPHSMVEHDGCIYCCSSSTGTLYRFTPALNGSLNFDKEWHITENHFLRGALRVADGWILGGSSRREKDTQTQSGMAIFHLNDNGELNEHQVAPVGEIYDILPWNNYIMRGVAKQCMLLPTLDLPGEFPARCADALLDSIL